MIKKKKEKKQMTNIRNEIITIDSVDNEKDKKKIL